MHISHDEHAGLSGPAMLMHCRVIWYHMSLWETLASWLDHPYTVWYECAGCGSRVHDPSSPCPECGSDCDPDASPEVVVDYWGLM